MEMFCCPMSELTYKLLKRVASKKLGINFLDATKRGNIWFIELDEEVVERLEALEPSRATKENPDDFWRMDRALRGFLQGLKPKK